MFNDTVWGEHENTEECDQNSIEVSKYVRRCPCGRWSFLGPGSEQTWYKTCSDKPNGNWDRTARMMILQLGTESGHPIFRASSAFERGEQDSQRAAAIQRFSQDGMHKKGTESLADHNIGEKEVTLFDRIALERHDFSATRAERLQNAKHWILRLSADGPKKKKTSSTATRICRCIETMPEYARCSPGGNAAISETDTSRTSTASTTRSAIRRRRNFDYFVDRKTGWWYYREPRRNPQAASEKWW